ncbi:hypothetical protein PENTCL1PPCAC_5136, partial [Pristionchus entomophagus]
DFRNNLLEDPNRRIVQNIYHGNAQNGNASLTLHVKVIRVAGANTFPSEPNPTVTVVVEDQKLLVDVPYVSRWSHFLQAYFASNMNESVNGIYPIKDCSVAAFREMLEVIYPSSKPIDKNNVEAMLELGDRYIMPMLTRKCEIFLSNNTSHGISEISMLRMADRFNLLCTRTIVLERLGTTNCLREKVIKASGYDQLSPEMRVAVDARYVQLDVLERE